MIEKNFLNPATDKRNQTEKEKNLWDLTFMPGR